MHAIKVARPMPIEGARLFCSGTRSTKTAVTPTQLCASWPAFIANQLGHSVQMLLSTYAKRFHSRPDWPGLSTLYDHRLVQACCETLQIPYKSKQPLVRRDIFLYYRAFLIRRLARLSPLISPVFPIKPGFDMLRSVAKKVVNHERQALSLDDGLHPRRTPGPDPSWRRA